MKIVVLLANGFEEGEALFLTDVLRRANFDVELVSTTGDLMVKGSHHIRVQADTLLDDHILESDALLLPGGQPGSDHLRDHPKVIEYVKAFNEQKKLIGAICAAPIVLHRAGFINQRSITSYPDEDYKKLFVDAGSHYVEEDVVVDGNIITSRGPALVLPFAYKIIEVLGQDSTPIKRGMLYKDSK